jgi:hypothetical protein
MTASADVCFVPRETRNNNHNKRTHRYVDQKLERKQKLAFKNKRHHFHDEDDSEDEG